jgi:hypothetical protein
MYAFCVISPYGTLNVLDAIILRSPSGYTLIVAAPFFFVLLTLVGPTTMEFLRSASTLLLEFCYAMYYGGGELAALRGWGLWSVGERGGTTI